MVICPWRFWRQEKIKGQRKERPAKRKKKSLKFRQNKSEGLRNPGKCSRRGTAASRENFMEPGREKQLRGQGRQMRKHEEKRRRVQSLSSLSMGEV